MACRSEVPLTPALSKRESSPGSTLRRLFWGRDAMACRSEVPLTPTLSQREREQAVLWAVASVRCDAMAFVETEREDGIMVIRMNRPERMNALGTEMRAALADAWCEFRDSPDVEVAIYTGTGRAFCAGEDMKETVERGAMAVTEPGRPRQGNPYDEGTLDKPVIAAINGFAMGGGFMLAERADLRVAV